jgi:hypothetical protein
MSLTRTVPASVPSLFHSSLPDAPYAMKNRVFSTAAVKNPVAVPPWSKKEE